MSPRSHSPYRWDSPERLALAHAGLSLVGITWAFGGNASWILLPLALWTSLAVPVLLAGLRHPETREMAVRTTRRTLWPFVLFNAVVLIACLSPGFRTGRVEGSTILIPLAYPGWRPSSAQPWASVGGLWIFDGLYLIAFNLYVIVRSRAALRRLLLLATANALALAIFGTVQKLAHARGIYFGRFPTPQAYFFATFVYDNHWGAFMVLMTAVCLGLTAHYVERSEGAGSRQSPLLGGLLAVLVLSVTVPLSGSRACSLLIGTLLAGTAALWIRRTWRRHRDRPTAALAPVGGLLVALALGAAAVWFVAGDTIAARVALTRQQVSAMRARNGIGSRSLLYEDTWRMARDRLGFGWGMDSYPSVFLLYNRQEPNPTDHLPMFYHDAHSDWLQSLAEHGVVGTVLLGLCALVPAWAGRGRRALEPLPRALLAGCGLVLLYAAVEFPFGNGAVVLTWWLAWFCALRYARLGPRSAPPSDSPAPAAPR
jgi:O-antigen ligase